jgi:protein-S-isoprenylcysteine O-methyltransferase Ste14
MFNLESWRALVGSNKDTKAMKVMALLSVLFLPGTFVATFFGMMITWDSSSQIDHQSQGAKYMRIYWIITIPLTLGMLLAYWLQGEYRTSSQTGEHDSYGGVNIDVEKGRTAADPLGYYPKDICYEL